MPRAAAKSKVNGNNSNVDLICTMCDEPFTSFKEFSNHVLFGECSLHNVHIHRCEVCDFVTNKTFFVKKHMSERHGRSADSIIRLFCTLLPTDSKGSSLPNIQQVDEWTCPFSCCSTIFTKTELQDHLKTVHSHTKPNVTTLGKLHEPTIVEVSSLHHNPKSKKKTASSTKKRKSDVANSAAVSSDLTRLSTSYGDVFVDESVVHSYNSIDLLIKLPKITEVELLEMYQEQVRKELCKNDDDNLEELHEEEPLNVEDKVNEDGFILKDVESNESSDLAHKKTFSSAVGDNTVESTPAVESVPFEENVTVVSEVHKDDVEMDDVDKLVSDDVEDIEQLPLPEMDVPTIDNNYNADEDAELVPLPSSQDSKVSEDDTADEEPVPSSSEHACIVDFSKNQSMDL